MRCAALVGAKPAKAAFPRSAEVGANRPERPVELSDVGDVARIRARALDLPLERGEPVAVPREHRDGVPAAREAPDDGCPRARSYPGDHRDWVRHAPPRSFQNFSLTGLT